MKRRILFLLFFAVSLSSLLANPIDVALAEKIAKNFYNHNAVTQTANFNLTYTEKSNDSTSVYFVFNVNQKDGFVIVSADDATTTPILGYSTEGYYSINNLPSNFEEWMGGYKEQINYIRENKLQATAEIKSKWQEYINNQLPDIKSLQTVGPYITTTWDQGGNVNYYDAMCPYDNTQKTNCQVGCEQLAMGQIMRYWKYPAKGTGSHSYSDPPYGTLSADFGSTTYNWANMPDAVTSKNDDVARLLYHCGVSTEASYSAGGTGGYLTTFDGKPSVQTALPAYFGYNSTLIQGVLRKNYPLDADWINLMKKELDNKRPILYGGAYPGTQEGHAFILDGYNADNFHINWGWAGNADGYFSLNNLTPAGQNFNADNEALIGIQPKNVGINDPEAINDNLIVYPNPVQNKLNINLTVDNKRECKILLYNNIGELLYQEELPVFKKSNIDVSTFTDGLYILQVLNNGKIYYKKFIINK